MKANYDKYEKALEYLDVYEDGSVWRKERSWITGIGVRYQPRQKAKTYLERCGYLETNVRIDGKLYNLKVHVLVALVHIPKPEGWTDEWEVNHINGVKTDCSVSNLEWVTRSENIRHADMIGLRNLTNADKRKPVEQIDLSTGEVVARYVSQSEAARGVGGLKSYISRCCLGQLRSHAGYGWRYA